MIMALGFFIDTNQCIIIPAYFPTVLFGADNGLQTVLVLSGVTTEEKLLSAENTITPDYYADTINDFFTPSEAKVTE